VRGVIHLKFVPFKQFHCKFLLSCCCYCYLLKVKTRPVVVFRVMQEIDGNDERWVKQSKTKKIQLQLSNK